MSVFPWSGASKRGFMLYKRLSGLYHPYFYKLKENAEKQIGWFGDEIHEIRITKIKPKIKEKKYDQRKNATSRHRKTL